MECGYQWSAQRWALAMALVRRLSGQMKETTQILNEWESYILMVIYDSLFPKEMASRVSNILSTPPPKASRYRTEIDGLRAFAVVVVIINHFNKDVLPGGYLGVDIFFVISGYVITSSLFERPSKDFRDFISGFYERRIKRLVPALSLYVLITSIAVCLFNPLPALSLRTGMTSLFGLSNLYLLKQSTDYFAQSTELNVFTHTWSLGVEEQFYIFFPFLVWFSGFGRQTKNGARNLFMAVGALTIASMVGFLYLYPTNQSAAYFMMPSRFWEMAAGCLIFIGFQKRASIEHFLEKVPPLLVLALIVAVMYLPKSMATGSTIAVVALSSVLIASLKKQTAAFAVFTHPRVVYIGLISYSLYLWHWGVLSISRWTIGIHWWSVPFQLALMLGLAVASYRWIETPMRKGNWIGKPRKTLLVCGGMLMTLSGSLFVLAKQPTGRFYAGDFREATRDDYSEHFKASREKCEINTYSASNCQVSSTGGSSQTMLLFGDSHAGHIIPLIGEVYANTNIGLNISISGYYPRVISSNNNGLTTEQSHAKADIVDKSFKSLTKNLKSGDIVILSSRWEHHLLEDSYNLEHKNRSRKFYSKEGNQIKHTEAVKIFEDKLSKVATILQSKGIKLIIFAPLPVFRGDEHPSPTWACTQEWFRPFISSNCSSTYYETREKIETRNMYISNALTRLSNKHENLYIYDPFEILCPGKEICTTIVDSKTLFRDDDHLSREGAKHLFANFSEFLSVNNLLTGK